MQNVMSVVTKTVNLIRSKGLHHREFQELLHSMDADFDDIPYYTEVRWLSSSKMLKRVFELKDAIQTFMESKGNSVEFMNEEWIEDFVFLVDITTHLNELNSHLQRKGQLIHSVFDHVNAFAVKLTLRETQIYNKNFVHFPTLQSLQVKNSQKYAKLITELRDDFDHRFTDFKKSAMHFNVFSCPFYVKIEEVPENLQMECIDLQCSSDLREKFRLSIARILQKKCLQRKISEDSQIGSFRDLIIQQHLLVRASFFTDEPCQIPCEITTF